MRRNIMLSMLFLLMAMQLFPFTFAYCDQQEPAGKMKIALIVAKPAGDNPAENIIAKGGPAKVEETEVPVQDNASDHFNRGVAHDNAGMHREAIESYRRAIMIRPDYAEAHYNLAFSYLISSDIKSAHEEYMLLTDMDPQMADDLYSKALLMVRSNPENKYVLQVGAFRNIQNANVMIEKLKMNYLLAQIETEDGFSKVRVFGIKNKDEAVIMMKDINDKFKIDPFLVLAK